MSLKNTLSLERIADGEVEGVEIAEALYVEEVPRDTIVARQVDGPTPVETYHQEAHVITQTETCAQGDVVEET